jgi:hypothetical protein
VQAAIDVLKERFGNATFLEIEGFPPSENVIVNVGKNQISKEEGREAAPEGYKFYECTTIFPEGCYYAVFKPKSENAFKRLLRKVKAPKEDTSDAEGKNRYPLNVVSKIERERVDEGDK